jgi:hypothetical protein
VTNNLPLLTVLGLVALFASSQIWICQAFEKEKQIGRG